MPEFIGIRDLTVTYGSTLAEAHGAAGFLPFRIHPKFRDEASHPPKDDRRAALLSHFFSPPAGYSLNDLPTAMEDRMLRGPRDLREVLALGAVIDEEKCDFEIYAPELTGRTDAVLKIHRHPEWQGLGLTISTIDPESNGKEVWDYVFIGFSEP